MSESLGISVQNDCYECMLIATNRTLDTNRPCYECTVLAQDQAKGYPTGPCHTCADKAMVQASDYQAGKCATCLKNDEFRSDNKAYNLHEQDRLGEGGACLTYDTSDEPSASEWVSSQTYVRTRGIKEKKPVFTEKWKDESMYLIELAVKFIDPDEPVVTRNEFLPPIAQLMDGGEYEELWELQDTRQRNREVECQWCHLLTPKQFNDCQDCDKPLELNVR